MSEHPIPARARVSGEERVALFVEEATAVQTTVERIGSYGEVPAAVASYLRDSGLGSAVEARGELRFVDWEDTGIEPDGDAGDPEGPVLFPAYAGVAETGSLCLSSEDAPLGAAFLPDTLLVVLDEGDLLATYEDLWRRGRMDWGGTPPSTLVLVAGPSRTADIEQSLVLGAHGPRRLHVLLVGSPAG